MNVKDVISAVVTWMKPTIDPNNVVMSRGGVIESVGMTSVSDIKKLFVGERIKFTFAEGIFYTQIATISGLSFTVSLTDEFASAPTACEVVLVFDHGHPLEIINRVKEYTESDSLKFEAFPRICLLHDFDEKVTFETAVSLTVLIITDTDPNYTASQRYTYTFDPMLLPLYELFISSLSGSDYIGSTVGNYFKHTKIDRLYWGKNGLYGNQGNIFNDYIDAVEIKDLELIITNC